MEKFTKIVFAGSILLSSIGIFSQSASAEFLLCTGTWTGKRALLCGVCPEGTYGTRTIYDFAANTTVQYCEISAATTAAPATTTTTAAPATTTTTTVSSGSSSSGTTTTSTTVSSGSSSSGTTTTTAPATTTTAPATTTTTLTQAVEDDGESEDDFAEIGVSRVNTKFDIRIFSSFVETKMLLRAFKKGKKSITWNISTNASGNYRIITKRALKGFRLSIWFDAERWDSLRVK